MTCSEQLMTAMRTKMTMVFLLLGTKARAEVNKVKQQRNKNAFIF